MLLGYQQEILASVVSQDALVIISKGLGLEFILTSIIKVYLNPQNLVFIINSTKEDQEWLSMNLLKENGKVPKILNSKSTLNERYKMYLAAGVIFIPSRILLYDILIKRLPIDLVGGIIVLRAHLVTESSLEAFALRLFRQANSTGFIKAFSDDPCSFNREFNQISRVMKSMYLSKLSLWPRFHLSVSSTMDLHSVDVVELKINLSKYQIIIQASLIDLINKCIRELLSLCPELKIYKEQLTLDQCLASGFVYKFNDIIDHSSTLFGPHAKQISADLLCLRRLLFDLTKNDAFIFEKNLRSIKAINAMAFNSTEMTFLSNAWLLWDSADNLFATSLQRIEWITSKIKSKPEDMNNGILFEINPKWDAVLNILKEVSSLEYQHDEKIKPSNAWSVLILANYPETESSLLKLINDPTQFITKISKKFLNPEQEEDAAIDICEQGAVKRKSGQLENNESTLTELDPQNIQTKVMSCWKENMKINVLGTKQEYEIQATLDDVQPNIIIMYDINLEWIRRLEMYKAFHPGKPLRIYMIMHRSSFEEQKYLISLKAEKEAFETLITEKACMIIPTNREGKEIQKNITESAPIDSLASDSRNIESNEKGNIVIDVREFGSELPLALHKQGFTIHPVALEIGDYIISPNCAIERKSVSDLVSSLNSGRLYDQAIALARTYSNPLLMIEFNNDRGFKFGINCKRQRGPYSINSPQTSVYYIQSKLLLLTLHCPSLRLLWCPSPEYSSKIFEILKKGKDEPDPKFATTVSSFESTRENTTMETNKSYDYLQRMPGAGRINTPMLVKNVSSLYDLVQLTQEELKTYIPNNNQILYDFLHNKINLSK